MTEQDASRTPTDAIVMAMERADDMEDVVVLYRLKKFEGHGGVGWISSIQSTGNKIGLIEEAKMGMFSDAYGIVSE